MGGGPPLDLGQQSDGRGRDARHAWRSARCPAARAPARQTTVTFTGGTQLVSVAAESNYVQLTAKGVRGNGFESAYEVTATLRPDTPVGKWYTDVWLNTNNPAVLPACGCR